MHTRVEISGWLGGTARARLAHIPAYPLTPAPSHHRYTHHTHRTHHGPPWAYPVTPAACPPSVGLPTIITMGLATMPIDICAMPTLGVTNHQEQSLVIWNYLKQQYYVSEDFACPLCHESVRISVCEESSQRIQRLLAQSRRSFSWREIEFTGKYPSTTTALKI